MRNKFLGIAIGGCLLGTAAHPAVKPERSAIETSHSSLPLWTTSSRLVKLGEALEFRFRVSSSATTSSLKIYGRYLEKTTPGTAFRAGGDLKWLESLPFESLPLAFSGGQAAVTYTPKEPGSYLAEWRVGDETYYRYFAAIDDSYIVLSFSTFGKLDPQPTFHGMGIPLDYRLPVSQFTPNDPLGKKLLDYNRRFGELIVPAFPDMPAASHDELARVYGEGLRKARALLPDPLDHRSIRVDMWHKEDPGYTRAFAELGINDHCGLWEANCAPWLGMPEFLYYASPEDCRKVNQSERGEVVPHQWDFCGSFHWLGPMDWLYAANEGRLDRAEECVTAAMDEFVNLTEMNRHPAFATPLYGGTTKSWADNPNPLFYAGDHSRELATFCEQYQRLLAFELTKKYKVVFTRSIDMVDYFRRHFRTTPSTVFSSKTQHPLHDVWWMSQLNNHGIFTLPERIPWSARLSSARKIRKDKDPLSCEFIRIEDQKRQIRFERQCPNPTWWFDYTRQDRNEKGSIIRDVEAPDVMILRSQSFSQETGLTISLTMKTTAVFPGYAIALWGLPIDYHTPPDDIATTAHSYTLVKNVNGETHMVLYFDLKPDAVLNVILRKPTTTRWEW